MTHLAIELLGTFRASVNGRSVPPAAWKQRRAAQLVKLLALSERRRLLRDQVIDALWPALAPEAGAANLHKAATHARQALCASDAVVLRGGEVALAPEWTVEVDAVHFEEAATEALASRDPVACRTAASLYGDLLPEERYEDWAEQPRRRLNSLGLDLIAASPVRR